MTAAPLKLSRCEKRVLRAIAAGVLCNVASGKSAALTLDLSERSYRRALRSLAEKGLIARTPYHPRRAHATLLLAGKSGQMAAFDSDGEVGEH